MAVENLLPDSDFIEFSNNDNEALTFTQQSSLLCLTDLSDDPPTKKRRQNTRIGPKGKPLPTYPLSMKKIPSKRNGWNFESLKIL